MSNETSLDALLAPIRERLTAATPAELELAGTEPSMSGQHFSIRRKGVPGLRVNGHEYGHGGAYIDLLVHAPTDHARLLAAIDAVTALHVPFTHHFLTPPAGSLEVCHSCRESYPCPTITAFTEALGGES